MHLYGVCIIPRDYLDSVMVRKTHPTDVWVVIGLAGCIPCTIPGIAMAIPDRFGYVALMAPFPVFLLLFLFVPLAEIYFLIKVGGWIGAFPTVVLVVLTAVLGAALARHQGLATLQRLQQTIGRGEAPALEMLEGGLLLVGALLLLTPGFLTDLTGFACLFPLTRRWLALRAVKRFMVAPSANAPFGTPGEHHPRTIEGEFQREDEEDKP